MLGGSPQNIGGFTDKSTTPLVVAGVGFYGEFGNQSRFPVNPVDAASRFTDSTWKQSITEEFKQISVGYAHVMGIKFDGTLWGWGRNNVGQVGDGTTVDKSTPVQIGSDTNWATVASGGFFLGGFAIAIKTTGTLWAWGGNGNGQLGDGTLIQKTSPIQIGSDTNWATVACGERHTIAIKSTGTLWAWGRNSSGQLGDGTTTERTAPVQIGSDTNWASVSCGDGFSIAIKTTGTLWGWGTNTFGQNGTTASRTAPFQIGSDTNWASVSCGTAYAMAIKTTGTLWGWGDNGYGQLGDGTATQRTTPVQIGSDTNWAKVAAGKIHTIAIKTTGTLYAWGCNGGGQFGETTNTGAKDEIDNYRNIYDPMQIGILINNTSYYSSSTWEYSIPGRYGSGFTNYYYYYIYDDQGVLVNPLQSNTIASAVISPNARKTP
jgi:alpha-tubulin suppressor-like RCC1 family protein